MDRNQTPTKSSIQLSDSELVKRSAPGGRLPIATTKDNALGDKGWTSISEGSPSAVAGRAEREHTRERPDLVARRAAKGK
jgi:hypothetical protein